jgi:hypothetical protein
LSILSKKGKVNDKFLTDNEIKNVRAGMAIVCFYHAIQTGQRLYRDKVGAQTANALNIGVVYFCDDGVKNTNNTTTEEVANLPEAVVTAGKEKTIQIEKTTPETAEVNNIPIEIIKTAEEKETTLDNTPIQNKEKELVDKVDETVREGDIQGVIDVSFASLNAETMKKQLKL